MSNKQRQRQTVHLPSLTDDDGLNESSHRRKVWAVSGRRAIPFLFLGAGEEVPSPFIHFLLPFYFPVPLPFFLLFLCKVMGGKGVSSQHITNFYDVLQFAKGILSSVFLSHKYCRVLHFLAGDTKHPKKLFPRGYPPHFVCRVPPFHRPPPTPGANWMDFLSMGGVGKACFFSRGHNLIERLIK